VNHFLRLGVIINPLPNNIVDGDVVDAVPVMNDFNWIVSQVNANVPPLINAGASPVTFVPAGGVGGSGNAITLTPTAVNPGYTAGQSYRFVAKAANTGAVTINVSGLGAVQLTVANGDVLIGGELQIGGVYDVTYQGSRFALVNFPLGSGLDVYTPVLSFGGASTGITYATQTGAVITIGNLVLVWIFIALTSKGSATGIAAVDLGVVVNTALPGSGGLPMGSMSTHQITFTGVPTPAPQPNSNSLNFVVSASGANVTFLNDTNFSNTSRLACFVIYTA
jgi:hypothetical protein